MRAYSTFSEDIFDACRPHQQANIAEEVKLDGLDVKKFSCVIQKRFNSEQLDLRSALIKAWQQV